MVKTLATTPKKRIQSIKWKIPYFDLVLGQEEKQAVQAVLETNWLTAGAKIQEFETAFAQRMNNPQVQAIAVSSCTAALHLALAVLGIGPGDEVICPSLTFVASANAIRYTGATPVFADICSETEWNLDPADAAAKITDNTKAIMIVHYGGYPCRMTAFLELARQYNLKIVEDACHGPLAQLEGKKLGTIGDIGCFSFFSNKNMTTGEGGMVVTGDADLAVKVKSMRSHGMTSTSSERFKGHVFDYDVDLLGFNYRLDEIRAALGIEQLKKLPENNRRRKHLVQYYRQAVRSNIPELTLPFERFDGNNGYHIFPVLLPEGNIRREQIMEYLAEHGVQTSIHYRPVHTFTAYQDFVASLPRTEAVASRILSLPLYPTLQESQIDYVVSVLKLAIKYTK